MIKVIDFWVDLGVDGFRCDVLDQISKDFENDLNSCGPRLHEYINALFGREKVSHIFTVGECWGANEENMGDLISGERKELSTSFQFEHIRVGAKRKFAPTDFKLDEVRDVFVRWQNLMQKKELFYIHSSLKITIQCEFYPITETKMNSDINRRQCLRQCTFCRAESRLFIRDRK